MNSKLSSILKVKKKIKSVEEWTSIHKNASFLKNHSFLGCKPLIHQLVHFGDHKMVCCKRVSARSSQKKSKILVFPLTKAVIVHCHSLSAALAVVFPSLTQL